MNFVSQLKYTTQLRFQLTRLISNRVSGSSRSGSALLIILGCVALLTVLVLSFFVTSRTEFTSSNFYARGVNTELLSENVINLVEAQLREGARSSDLLTSQPVAWVSQPGMIRTYDNAGLAHMVYKLYSSDTMNCAASAFTAGTTDLPDMSAAGWAAQPNVYTDLNEPITTAGGGTEYPIIDPTCLGSVEGFAYTAQNTANGTTNPLPMPVKWLYVLKNGTLVTGTAATAGAASITGASLANPIIGRVAFWTDDETSKVNINTASEGIFWDRPDGSGQAEHGNTYLATPVYGYGLSLPASAEFQRTAGHPATTSLSPVFGYGTHPVMPMTGLENTALTWPLSTTSYGTYFAPYFSLTPRLQAGATMGGAQLAPLTPTFLDPGYRLYDSVDELVYDPARAGISGAPNTALYLAANGASPAGRQTLGITPLVVNQRRFFITAHSRAPEETLFGTPRISLWPLQTTLVDPINGTFVPRTARDNLLAYCSTINTSVAGVATTEPYFFQRASIYQYQQVDGGPVVTYSGTPSSQSTTADFPGAPTTTPQTGVARNENIYAYLQALTSNPIPGFGGNFLSKYPGGPNGNGDATSDRDEILTEMFDLIRSGVNTYGISTGILPHYTFTPYLANAAAQEYGQPTGSGSTYPIAINTTGAPKPNTHGLGRTYDIAEASIVFMAAAVDGDNGYAASGTTPATGPVGAGNIDPQHSNRISIGVGLPWAYAIDNPAFFSHPPFAQSPPAAAITSMPKWLYWDHASSPPGYGAYVYEPADSVHGTPAMRVPVDFGTNQPQVDTNGKFVALSPTAVTIGDPQTTAVRAFVLVRFYNLLDGPPAMAPHVRVRITGLDNLSISFGSSPYTGLGFNSKNNAVLLHNVITNALIDTSGGLTDFIQGLNNPGPEPSPTVDDTAMNQWGLVVGPNTGGSDSVRAFPWASAVIPLPTAAYPSPYGGEDPSPQDTSNVVPLEAVAPPAARAIHLLTNGTNYAGSVMGLNGGQITVEVLDDVNPIATAQTIESIPITIPPMNNLPVPTVEMATNDSAETCGYGWTATGCGGNAIGGPRIPGYCAGTVPPSYPPGAPMPLTVPAATCIDGSHYDPYYLPTFTNSSVPGTRLNWQYYIRPVYYFWQLPYDERSLADRLSGGGDAGRMILNGDVVRSFEVAPAGEVAGDMRLLGANPIQTHTFYPGDTGNIFVPLGGSRSGGFYNSFPTQGPWNNNPFIKQLHTLYNDANFGRGGFNLTQTSQAILTSTPIGALPNIGGGGAGVGESLGALIPNEHYASTSAPVVTPELNGAYMDSGLSASPQIPGDWSGGTGDDSDGPFIVKPDEGAMDGQNGSGYAAYYQTDMIDLAFEYTNVSFSPNRQVPSGIIFGTLPSRAIQGVPWCTLLFSPNPAANDNGSTTSEIHYGYGKPATTGALAATNDPAYYSPPYTVPPDHLFLDLFWMPVVEPYAISEPFSTAGKVNMNYEIVPFGTYVHRSTALHAVLKSTRIMAIPTVANDADGTGNPGWVAPTATSPATAYWPSVKAIDGNSHSHPNMPNAYTYRYGINLPATIDDFATTAYTPTATNGNAFYNRFIVQNDLFRSASEICDAFLVPAVVPGSVYYPTPPAQATGLPTDASYTSMQAWWANFKLTGDNAREEPYNQIYPRLTTKSNTFQVHMRVQTLAQTPADRAAGTFNATAGDSITSEYRGSAIVERYLDPSQTNPGLPDFATTFPASPTAATSTVDNYVRYRVVNTHAFSP